MTGLTLTWILLVLIVIGMIIIYINMSMLKKRVEGIGANNISDEDIFIILKTFVTNIFDDKCTEEEEMQSALAPENDYEVEKKVLNRIVIKTQQQYRAEKPLRYTAEFRPGTQQIKPKSAH